MKTLAGRAGLDERKLTRRGNGRPRGRSEHGWPAFTVRGLLTGAKKGALSSERKLRWSIPASDQRPSTTSPTSYTINQRHSKSVVSSLSHGFRAPERTCSPSSRFLPMKTSNRGRKPSRILRTLPGVIPTPCPFVPREPP